MDKIPEVITKQWLKERDACADQRRLFNKVFPDGMKVNLTNLRKAREAKLSVMWLIGQASCSGHQYCVSCYGDEAMQRFAATLKNKKLLVKAKRKTA